MPLGCGGSPFGPVETLRALLKRTKPSYAYRWTVFHRGKSGRGKVNAAGVAGYISPSLPNGLCKPWDESRELDHLIQCWWFREHGPLDSRRTSVHTVRTIDSVPRGCSLTLCHRIYRISVQHILISSFLRRAVKGSVVDVVVVVCLLACLFCCDSFSHYLVASCLCRLL